MQIFTRKFLFAFFVVIFIPNILFFLFSYFSGVNRSIINIDYSVSVLLILFGYRCFGGLLLFVFFVVESLALIGQIMPFMRFGDLFYLLSLLGLAPLGYKILAALAFGGGVVIFLSIFSLAKCVERVFALSTLNVLVFVYLFDVLFLGSNIDNRFWRAGSEGLVVSQSVYLYEARSSSFIANFEGTEAPVSAYKGKAASDFWRSDLANNILSNRLLLIVAESWGVPVSKEVQAALLEPLFELDLESHSAGTISFEGVTVGGELRELCQLSPNSFNLAGVGEEFSKCLPRVLGRDNYVSASLHGAGGLMYGRKDWYPNAGFTSSTFLESIDLKRRCYSFPGACDIDLYGYLINFFSGEGRRFFYWLTLNSHSLYDSRDLLERNFNCELIGMDETQESCRNLMLHAQFFKGLANILARKEMQGVDVIIVGDHEPRVFNKEEKDRVFIDGQIPWVRLRVKGAFE